MRLPSLRNTMNLHKWHGRAAGLACLPCFSLAEGLTTFNSLLALAIVSAVGLQSQFGRRKMNLVCFSLRFCHNSLILQVTCIPWLSQGGRSHAKEFGFNISMYYLGAQSSYISRNILFLRRQ